MEKSGFPLSSKPWLCIYLHLICSYNQRMVKVGKGFQAQIKTGHSEYLSLYLQNCNPNVKLN